MRLFKPSLRQVLAERVVVIDMVIGDTSQQIELSHGKIRLLYAGQHKAHVKVEYRSLALAQNVIQSAIRGNNFWLTAMRDHRLIVTGDISSLVWFFAMCRHLQYKKTTATSS